MGDQRVVIQDISVGGVRVLHQHKFAEGETPRLKFTWDGEDMAFDCALTRTEVDTAQGDSKRVLYTSGARFTAALAGSEKPLREMIANHVMRALDEQKANARGLPPMTTTFLQTAAKQAGYIRCELVGGAWRKTQTDRPDQPRDGFTVSAQEEWSHIEMLCKSYQDADRAGRDMLRQLAALSVSSEGGVATRRFNP